MELPDIFEPYEKLIEIEIIGTKHMVPENNSLLRCFQFLAMKNISYGDFCWNGECLNCPVWIQNGDKEKAAMACRPNATEGIRIIRLPRVIQIFEK